MGGFTQKRPSARSRRGPFGALFGALARLVEKIGNISVIGSGAVAGAVGAHYWRAAALKGGAPVTTKKVHLRKKDDYGS